MKKLPSVIAASQIGKNFVVCKVTPNLPDRAPAQP